MELILILIATTLGTLLYILLRTISNDIRLLETTLDQMRRKIDSLTNDIDHVQAIQASSDRQVVAALVEDIKNLI